MAKKSLRKLSTRELQVELERRQRLLPRMQQRHGALLRELREIEGEIAELSNGGAPAPVVRTRRGRLPGRTAKIRRARNTAPLAEVMSGVMSSSQPMRVGDIAEAVRRAGYRSKARNFSSMVNQALIKDPRFKQSSRGHYVLA